MPTPTHPSLTVSPPPPRDAREALVDLYWAAVRAAAPGAALRAALERIPEGERDRRVWIFAIGKSAYPMAETAVDVLAEWGRAPAGGVIVAPRALATPHEALETAVGDHPVPGERSLDAASRIGHTAARVRSDDEAWVLLSGGTTSLIAAPEGLLRPADLVELYTLLLGSGLAIREMNVVRKRFSRWGAGRLAVALGAARVRNYIVSDVIGDDVATIGSGPCVPDPSTASGVHLVLDRARLWERMPAAARRDLLATERDPELETPKPGHRAFAHVERRIVASNRIALDAMAARARELGYEPRIVSAALAGEASVVGARVAAALAGSCADGGSEGVRGVHPCLIWGGEPTVTLGEEASGRGGRCQELALAAARELASLRTQRPASAGATLLAAGTDGRDGDTDAAGAIVDAGTWSALAGVGRDGEHDLARHDSHPALDAVGALLRTDLTATNVMDVVVGVCGPPPPPARSRLTPAAALERISGSMRRIAGKDRSGG